MSPSKNEPIHTRKAIFRDFASDIANDAIAKWSGLGGLLMTVAEMRWPDLLGGVRPFLWLGTACFFVSCLRAWAVEHLKTVPRFVLIVDHPIERQDQRGPQGNVFGQVYRVVVGSCQSGHIDDVRVYASVGSTGLTPIELKPSIGWQQPGTHILRPAVPAAFDLFDHRFAGSSIQLQGKISMPVVPISPTSPEIITVSITGNGVPTMQKTFRVYGDPMQPLNVVLQNAKGDSHGDVQGWLDEH